MPEPVIIYGTPKPEVELADVFLLYGQHYLKGHNVSKNQRRAIRDITRCRTAELGGHVDVCDECSALRISYNS
jgi:hypothetical protein